MKIKVTVDHIERGRPGDCEVCPIGLAALDSGIEKAIVGEAKIEGSYNNEKFFSRLPTRAQAFIRKYDREEPVKPFNFIIRRGETEVRVAG